jgi:WD40 repeat protein
VTNEASETDNEEGRSCPQCGEHLTKVGVFWVCPTHGQVPEPRPFTALRIFLSYGHDANEELVCRIKADLEQRGHDVWFDKTEIKAGDDWRRAITEGIINSQRVVSFLSKHSTRDPGVCRDEIAIAIGVKGGSIQTILVESETEVRPPVNIGHIQWLDMHDWRERRAVDETTWEEWYQIKFAEVVRVVESDESRRFAGEIETLHAHLRPIRSDARIYDLLRKGFLGRTWLFEAVEKWRQDAKRGSRLFWITGDPGVGKSAFAAQLTHTRSDAAIAAQFVEWDKRDHRDARRVVRSLAFQLATRLPDYRKFLLTLPEIAELDRKDPAELFDYLLTNPLRSVIGGGRERQLIVIDALDEAGEAGRNPLVEMLARHAPRLPDWLGLVVTSRPESAVQTPLQGLNPFVLDTRTEANRTDLRDYLQQRLAPQLHDRADGERLLGQILDKSEGVFLYVERFCDDVEQNHLSLDRPDQFPQGLGGIFSQWFDRQFPDLEKFRKDVRPALRAILAAREPLPVEILQRVFDWQDEELRDFTRTLGSLFPVAKEANGEIIKPYHKSLADWLADEAKAGAYFVSVLEGHRLLSACGWRDYEAGPQKMPEYFLLHLPAHLLQLQMSQELGTLLGDLDFVQSKCSIGAINQLLEDYDITFADHSIKIADCANIKNMCSFVSRHALVLSRMPALTLQQAANQTDFLSIRDTSLRTLSASSRPWVRLRNPGTDIAVLSTPCDITGSFLANLHFSIHDITHWNDKYGKPIRQWLEARSWFERYPWRLVRCPPVLERSNGNFLVMADGMSGLPTAVDITSGSTVREFSNFEFPTANIDCLSVSPDGSYLACGGKEGWMQILKDCEPFWSYRLPPKRLGGEDWDRPWIYGCSFSHNGRWCAFGDGEGRCHIVDTESKRISTSLQGIGNCNSYIIAWRPNSDQLVLAKEDFGENPQVVNWRSGESIEIAYDPHTKSFEHTRYSLTFDRAGRLLIVSGGHYTGIWDADSYVLLRRINRHADRAVFLDDDEHIALWNAKDEAITLYRRSDVGRASAPTSQRNTLRHESSIRVVSSWPASSLLFSSSNSGIMLTDLNTLEETKGSMNLGVVKHVNYLSNEVLVAGVDLGLFRYELAFAGRQLEKHGEAYGLPDKHDVDALTVRGKDNTIATASDYDGTVRLWKLSERGLTETHLLHGFVGNDVHCLEFSPDGNCVAVGANSKVIIWDLRKLKVILSRDNSGGYLHFMKSQPVLLVGSGNYCSGLYERFDLSRAISDHLELLPGWPVFSEGDEYVAIVKDNLISIFECTAYVLQARYMARNPIACATWHGSDRLILGCEDGSLEVLDVKNISGAPATAPISISYPDAVARLGYMGSFEHEPLCYGPDDPHSGRWFTELSGSRWPQDWDFLCLRCGTHEGDRLRSCPKCGYIGMETGKG